MTVRELAAIVEAETVCGADLLERPVVLVCGCDLMSDVLAFASAGAVLLTGLANPQVVRTAEMSEINAICFVRGKQPPPETVQLAEEKRIPLLTCRLSLYEACGRLHRENLPGYDAP